MEAQQIGLQDQQELQEHAWEIWRSAKEEKMKQDLAQGLDLPTKQVYSPNMAAQMRLVRGN